jgi:hypothetical protein
LAVEVTPEGVRGFWDGQPMGELTAAAFAENARAAMATLAGKEPGSVYARELWPVFTPRGSLGLYAVRSSASFRNVVIEPLTKPQ